MHGRCVRKWLDSCVESTRDGRWALLESFFKFCDVDPERAVEFQRKNPISYKFVDLAYEWVEKGDLAVGTMRFRVGLVRGYFLTSRAPLPQDKHRYHSEKVPVLGELSVEEFRRIVLASNRTYKAAFLVQFQSGSGVGQLLHINTKLSSHIWNEVRKGKRIIRLNMPGRKQNRNIRPYYTFIGFDAVDALRELFYNQGWKEDSVLFRTEYGDPISAGSLQRYFQRMAIKLGLIKAYTPPCNKCGGETVKKRGKKIHYLCTTCHSLRPASDYNITPHKRGGIRYKMRTHELRDLFRTEFHRAQTYTGADPVAANFFMGHAVDRLEYDKLLHDERYGLEQYRRAMSFLNILSEDPRRIDRTEIDSQLEASQAQVETLTREMMALKRKMARLEVAFKQDLKDLET